MIANRRKKSLALGMAFAVLLGTIAMPTANTYAEETRTFPETGKTLADRFLEYWDANGGLAQQGFPISEEMEEVSDTDGQTYTVQYFERAVFEKHPEEAPPYDVLLSLVGTFNYNEKHGGEAPDQVASTDNPMTFPETGKTVGGVFRTYWETHGGLAQQGFPISDEFQELDKDGVLRTVQYFERAVFEYHEELAGTEYEVLLSLLGTAFHDRKYGSGSTPPPVGEIPPGGLSIFALGDSLTQGEGDDWDGGGYPARLLAAVNEIRPGSRMTNLGVSGWTSQQMVDEQLPTALAANPDIALVWIGSNDLWLNGGPETEATDIETFRNNIDTTLRSLTEAGAKVYIALLDDQSQRPYSMINFDTDFRAHMTDLALEFNEIISTKATEYGATPVDFFNTTIFTDAATLAEDGVHPNPAGYDVIAQVWFDAIREVLGGGGATIPTGEVPNGSLTIVALGDSLTEGMGDRPDGGGYPARLLAAVNEVRPDTQLTNLGVSGWTSQQMVDEQLPTALNANPDIALVWIGANNIWYNNGPEGEEADLDSYRTDIDTTLRSLTEAGAKVYIALLHDQSKLPYTSSPNGAGIGPLGVAHISHLVTEFNEIVGAKAAEYGATTVDFYNVPSMTDPAMLAEDEAHPNEQGFDVIAQIWFDAISQDLE